VYHETMANGFDSWVDGVNYHPDDTVHRGDGYAIGGHGTRNTVRIRARWRAQFAHQIRLAVLDTVMLCAVVFLVWLTWVTKSEIVFIITAVVSAVVVMFFKHQRYERERRPR